MVGYCGLLVVVVTIFVRVVFVIVVRVLYLSVCCFGVVFVLLVWL